MKHTITFIYVGRLSQEKWFDLILQIAQKSQNHYSDRVRFFIFGDGNLKKNLLQTMQTCPNIHYFGRKSLGDIINIYIPNCHYALMPSRFLETFWLSAGEMMMSWLPVIGPAKWWLEQFISKPFDTLWYSGNEYTQLRDCISHIIEHHTEKLRHHYHESVHKTALSYSSTDRLQRFDTLTWRKDQPSIINQPKTIILVSDFLDHIGGIESYVHNTAMLLEQEWYRVILYGQKRWTNKVSSRYKLRGIAQSIYNRRWARNLEKMIKESNPDLIRYHSVNRRLWWRGISASRKVDENCKKRLMIHDRGITTPYPSKITSYKQLPTHRVTIKYRLQFNNRIHYPLLIGKYITTTLLWWSIRTYIDTILIPSNYMRVPLQHQITPASKPTIVHLPHYLMIQEKKTKA